MELIMFFLVFDQKSTFWNLSKHQLAAPWAAWLSGHNVDLCPSSLQSVSAEDRSKFFFIFQKIVSLSIFLFSLVHGNFSVPDYKFESENVEAWILSQCF